MTPEQRAASLTDALDDLPDLQKRALLWIAGLPGGHYPSAQDIAHHLGFRPARTGILAASSAMRALTKKGWIGRLPPRDQWDSAAYFVTREGKVTLAERNPTGRNRS